MKRVFTACGKWTVLVAVIGLIAACVPPLKKTVDSGAAISPSRLSPPPTAPGLYENKEIGFVISFPESVNTPKNLDSPNQVFYAAATESVPICQVFINDIPLDELLEPAAARKWMAEKLEKANFSRVEIVRTEMISLGEGIEALFLAEKFRWNDGFFWGAHVIVDHKGKRITVFGIDDGRLDRIESTVMSLKLID